MAFILKPSLRSGFKMKAIRGQKNTFFSGEKVDYCFWPVFREKNTIEIWYLNNNEAYEAILEQPQNHKFEIGYAQAKSAKPHLNQYVDFISSRTFLTCTKF